MLDSTHAWLQILLAQLRLAPISLSKVLKIAIKSVDTACILVSGGGHRAILKLFTKQFFLYILQLYLCGIFCYDF